MLTGFTHQAAIELAEELTRIPITSQEINLMGDAATSGIAAAER